MPKRFQVDSGGTLLTSLVSYYKLEDVNDYIGDKYLTNYGSTPFNAGKVNNAADFGASNTTKYLHRGVDLVLGNGSQSYSAWFNIVTAPAANTAETIVANEDNAAPYLGFFLRYIDVAGVKNLEGARLKGLIAMESVLYTWTADANWHHAVLKWDGINLVLYLDGTQVATGTPSGSGTGNGGFYGTHIGARCDGAGINGESFLSGLVDEVGIWSKVLSATEIADLYNGGAGQTMVLPSGMFLMF